MSSFQKTPNIPILDSNLLGLLSPSDSLNNTQVVAQTANGICFKNRVEIGKTVVKQITSAQLLALNATPISVVPAPVSSSYVNVVRYWQVWHGTGTAYAGIASGEDLALKYTDGSGAIAATVIETTGFLDQTTAQLRLANALSGSGAAASTPADLTPVAGAAIVVQLLSGEITTGNFAINILVVYDTIPVDLTA